MGEVKESRAAGAAKAQKPSFFKGVKSEFRKISWPNRNTVGKQTLAVVSVSIVVGLIITILDFFIQIGVNFLVG